jgi:hypothetical protein
MSLPYSIEASTGPQNLLPRQAALYESQLQAVAIFALHGAAADIGAGSEASQDFMRIGSGKGEPLTAMVWRGDSAQPGANFAALPVQAVGRKYFGIASQVGDGTDIWVEGVNLHPTGSVYTKLRLGVDPAVAPNERVPLAIGALVETTRPERVRASRVAEAMAMGIDVDTHRRLGNAILSFWDTVTGPPQLSTEHSNTRSAFELANFVLAHQLGRLKDVDIDDWPSNLVPFIDARGMTAGFTRIDEASNSLTSVIRNNTTFPEVIDYIQIPMVTNEDGDSIIVNHHSITRDVVGTRVCVLPAEMVAAGNISTLLNAVQIDDRPVEFIDDTNEVDVIVRDLHAEMGSLLNTSY